jgi:hypothetical protein
MFAFNDALDFNVNLVLEIIMWTYDKKVT